MHRTAHTTLLLMSCMVYGCSRAAPPAPVAVAPAPTAAPQPARGPVSSEFTWEADPERWAAWARSEAVSGQAAIAAAEQKAPAAGNASKLSVPDATPGAPLQADFDAQYLAYRMREVETYRKLTADTAEAQAAGDAFLTAYMHFVCNHADTLTDREVVALGDDAVSRGSNDPLLRAYLANIRLLRGADPIATQATLRECAKELDSKPYPDIIRAALQLWIFDNDERLSNPDIKRAEPVIEAIVRWLKSESSDKSLRRCTYQRLMSFYWTMPEWMRNKLVESCLHKGGLDSWVLHTLLGEYYIQLGHVYLNGGDPRRNAEQLREAWGACEYSAHLHLRYAWSLDPQLPEPASRLIHVADSGYDETSAYAWFTRAVQAQFDYLPAYQSFGDCQLPKYEGSDTHVEAFARQCIQTGRFDTSIPLSAVDLLRHARDQQLGAGASLADVPGARGVLELLLQKRDEYRKTGNAVEWGDRPNPRTWLAMSLLDCGLTAEALTEFRALGAEVDTQVLQYGGRPGVHLLARTFAEAGSDAERVAALDQLLRRDWPREAPAELIDGTSHEIDELEKANTDPAAGSYYRQARVLFEQLQRYSRGEPVELRFDADLAGCEVFADEFNVESDGAAVVFGRRRHRSPQLQVRPLAAFRPPFVIEAELEIVEPYPYPGAVGIHWSREASSAANGQDQQLLLFGFESIANGSAEAHRRSDVLLYPQQSDRSAMPSQQHGLKLRLWESAYEFSIDGNPRFGQLPRGLAPDASLSFGEFQPCQESKDLLRKGGEVRLANVRLRRLDVAAPPDSASTPADEQIAYWESRLAAEPEDASLHVRVAQLRLAARDFAAAESLARRALELSPEVDGAHAVCGLCLYEQRQYAAALSELRAGIAEGGQTQPAAIALAMILAAAPDDALRNGREAFQLANHVIGQTQGNSGPAMAAQAAAQAELGRFKEAATANRSARMLSEDDDVAEIEARQKLYEANQPFRLPLPE